MKTGPGEKIFFCAVLAFSLTTACAPKEIPPAEMGEQAPAGQTEEKAAPVGGEPSPAAAAPQEPAEEAAAGIIRIDMQRAGQLLKDNRFDDLLDLFSPDQLDRLLPQEKIALAALFHQAAQQLLQKVHDVSYAALFCERGLMLDPHNQDLLRLQIENYLNPELRIYGGAEELAEKLLEIDAENQLNQMLRGRVAFEQAEWDVAVKWLEKAARVGRTEQSREVKEAWKLLDLARARAQEIKSSLSMTMELERKLASARERLRQLAEEGEAEQLEGEAATPGGDIVLYMTSWCGYCRKARELLKSLKVTFQEKDIEKDKEAALEMLQLAEQKGVEITGVPVVRIGNDLVVGFNAQRIRMLVEQVR